ncbi:class I adenylate-forming enzyme family protein [Nonomuraea cavernae]|uniref:Fatty-acyl-CoA synthase n=1 Tax=Nonomuraea cavernae TaxID=2045107 RepID=A0A918DKV4_9ACTN|nr:AMP-binding protein [Nonomuraea cavernae]MCA2186607.1 AMP-binding protein [Nonomuraea cavernae]GGO71591.1 fatty-acyl-CoA synthase [Nonomuraea cavernae]
MPLLPGGAALSIAGGVREFAVATPEAAAVVDGDRRLTYRALDERSSRLANVLLDAGLRPGERVAVLLGNRLEYPEVACGIAKAGLVMVPVNPRSAPVEAAYVLGHSQSRALIQAEELGGLTAGAAPETVLTIGGTGAERPYESALEGARSADPRVPVGELEPFCVAYTSGTTGHPKGVVISHRSRSLTFYGSALEWGLATGRRTIAVAPMYHGAGFAFGYAPVHTGGTVAMLRAWDPEHLLAMIERERAQSVFLVPTHAHGIRALGEAALRRHDLSSLDTIYFNAAALPRALKEWVLDAFPGVGVHELYGSTEAGIVTDCRPADARRKVGSVGQPWFMTEIRVVDDDGRPVGPGVPGELFSRSPYLMSGYLRDPAATAACVTDDGFLSSGDIVVRDDEGYVYIVDRKKDMIISGGVNIAPREVEEVLQGFPGVAEAAVVGLPDEEWGERVAAYVVRLPGAEVSGAELEAHCRTRLSGPKLPRTVVFVPSLPRNAAGKILKRELRDGA